MAVRVFALIIGIDNYKSGGIWNLLSCADDARGVKHWLTHDLHVPRDQIRLLLDSEATKQNIEDHFMGHLVNNPSIERGDAILVYFAGHGSSLIAPRDWFQSKPGKVEVLCPYDHDTKGREGRVAGISDRSMHALIGELCRVKGDNITVMLDCCFSPPRSRMNIRDRQYTRWTPTSKATSDDLYLSLWSGAVGQTSEARDGFYQPNSATHTLFAACQRGQKAMEGHDGGKFTSALLRAAGTLALHRTTGPHFIDQLDGLMGENQRPVCLGRNKNRVIFDGVPFIPDTRYVPVAVDDKKFRVGMGAIHGIVEGTEFSLHGHNYRASLNPPLASVRVLETHPTWSLAECKSQGQFIPTGCWAQITRWNNHTPFRVYLKKGFTSVFRRWKLRRKIPSKLDGEPSEGGLNILRVKHPEQADVSLSVGCSNIVVKRHDGLIAANCHRVIRLEKSKGTLNVVDDAARFHLHLHRKNPTNPLRNLVTMEIFRLDPRTWSKVGSNLVQDGKAIIPYEKGAIYTVDLRNDSDIDLWPCLSYMDPNGYRVTMIYQPDPSLPEPPLRKNGHLAIGSGMLGSEALSFSLPDHVVSDSGFLKLFISSIFTPMGVIEQGPPQVVVDTFTDLDAGALSMSTGKTAGQPQLWDTAFACVTITRNP